MFIVDLSAVIGENSHVEVLGLQANLKSNFLPMGIAHCTPARDADHLFKHLDSSTGENGDSSIETYQQTLRHSIATLTFAFRIDFVRRNLSRMNQNNFN